MQKTDFYADIARGKVGEKIFVEDFLNFLNIQFEDVTNSQAFRIIDTDFAAKIGNYEIKSNYRDNNVLIFEDYTNINEGLGPVSKGWVYKSKADIIVFISKETRIMIFLPFTSQFKKHYEDNIKPVCRLIKNKVSTSKNNHWQSAFRVVNFNLLSGFISLYKKKKGDSIEQNIANAAKVSKEINKQLNLFTQ